MSVRLQFRGYTGESLRLGLISLIELLVFLPLLIIFARYLLPESVDIRWMLALPLSSVAGVLLRRFGNVRWKQLGMAVVIGMAVGFLAIAGTGSLSCLSLGAAGLICSIQGLTADARTERFRIYWAGIAIYLLAALIFPRIPALEGSIPLITWCGSLTLILTLFMSNSHLLRYSSLSEENGPLPAGLRRHNRVFVIGILLAAVLLAVGAGRAIAHGIWLLLSGLISWISGWFTDTPPPQPPSAPPAAAPEMLPDDTAGPGLLGLILDIALYVFAAAVIGTIIYFSVRWLYRNAGGTLRRAMDALLKLLRRQHVPQDSSRYRDEESSVFTWDQALQGLRNFWSRRFSPGERQERWDQLNSGQEKVRWLYRHWVGQQQAGGYEAKASLTPQETAADVHRWKAGQAKTRKGAVDPDRAAPLIRLYEQVRYGGKEPPHADVTAVKEQLKL